MSTNATELTLARAADPKRRSLPPNSVHGFEGGHHDPWGCRLVTRCRMQLHELPAWPFCTIAGWFERMQRTLGRLPPCNMHVLDHARPCPEVSLIAHVDLLKNLLTQTGEDCFALA